MYGVGYNTSRYSSVTIERSANHQTSTMEDTEMGTTEAYPQSPPEFDKTALIRTMVLSVMFVISFVGNSLTLLLIFYKKKAHSTTSTLIGHLALSDLIVTFFCNGAEAIWTSTVQWLVS